MFVLRRMTVRPPFFGCPDDQKWFVCVCGIALEEVGCFKCG